jgi:D-glycero-alpha-D-manno-heptose-7-phosphate kinase
MIIIKTPLRISFFGGGTDYPEWYSKHGGQVISTAIDKYIYLNLDWNSFRDEKKYIFSWRKTEKVNNPNKIFHPCVREVLKFYKKKFKEKKIKIYYSSDLPGNSGLGSSSAFMVGLINGINLLLNKKLNKRNLAKKSIFFERDILKENVGLQDQIICSFGGFRHTIFFKNGSFKSKEIKINKKNKSMLEKNLILINTHQKRFASNIAKTQILNIDRKINYYKKLNIITEEAKKVFSSKRLNILKFSQLLNRSWEIKKDLSPNITNRRIDKIISMIKKNGAIGAKLLGAGGGGFILAVVPSKLQARFKKKVSNLSPSNIKFYNSGSLNINS